MGLANSAGQRLFCQEALALESERPLGQAGLCSGIPPGGGQRLWKRERCRVGT